VRRLIKCKSIYFTFIFVDILQILRAFNVFYRWFCVDGPPKRYTP
jgi:hypothetical protein